MWGIPFFKEATLVPHVPSLCTLHVYCRKERLDLAKLAAMTALQSLCASTGDAFAAIEAAVPALLQLTYLTRLSFSSDFMLASAARSSSADSGCAMQDTELSRVLRQLSALVWLQDLYLAGLDSKVAQALDGTIVFPALEVLHLRDSVAATDGLLEFLACSRSLAAVWLGTLECPGTKSALLAFRLAVARGIGTHVRVTVHWWSCRDESEGKWLGRVDPLAEALALHATL